MIEMINSNILVEPIEEDNKSGSAIITTVVKKDPTRGVVVSVGKGKYLPDGTREDHGIKVGDTILFGQGGLGNKVRHNDKDFLVMSTESVLGIIRE